MTKETSTAMQIVNAPGEKKNTFFVNQIVAIACYGIWCWWPEISLLLGLQIFIIMTKL